MKSIILILFIIGISLIIIGYYEHMQLNPVNKIEYRYIPRNYLEDQMADQNLRKKKMMQPNSKHKLSFSLLL